MKLSPRYLKLISEQQNKSETLQMIALALMAFGGRVMGGVVFQSLQDSYSELLNGGDANEIMTIAKSILSEDGFSDLKNIVKTKINEPIQR